MAGPVVFSDIALKARQHARQIAVWTLLRELDVDGQGWIWRQSAIEAIREYLPGGGGPLSRQSIRRILRAGDNIFWVLARHAAYLRSPTKVCRALGIERVRDGEPMTLDELSGPIGELRARLAIRGIARIRKERPVSNAAMSAMAGVSTRTIKTYKRRSGVPSIESFELVAPYDRVLWAAYRVLQGPRYRVIRLMAFKRFAGPRWICRQIGNSLACGCGRGRIRSRLRRVNRALRSFDFSGRGHPQRFPSTSRRGRVGPPSPSSYVYQGYGRKTDPGEDGGVPPLARIFHRAT